MIDMDSVNDSPSVDPVDVKPFIHNPWFSLNPTGKSPIQETKPASLHNEDSSSSSAFTADENSSYFQFFRGIHNDYQELPLKKQRLFKRKCLNLLHELLDEEEGNYAYTKYSEQDSVLNLSNSGHVSEEERDIKPIPDDSYILPNTWQYK